MHADLSVTDGVDAILSETDAKKQIVSLAHIIENSDEEKLPLLISLAKQLEHFLHLQELGHRGK
jgi:hypothetical protein